LQKNTIKWVGGNEDPEMEKEIVDMKRKLDDLTEEERKIDKNISELNAQIKN
jgi:hypothetical protein